MVVRAEVWIRGVLVRFIHLVSTSLEGLEEKKREYQRRLQEELRGIRFELRFAEKVSVIRYIMFGKYCVIVGKDDVSLEGVDTVVSDFEDWCRLRCVVGYHAIEPF